MTLPLKDEDEPLVVPRAALLRDFHGGTWVYEKVGEHAYARRRVDEEGEDERGAELAAVGRCRTFDSRGIGAPRWLSICW